MIQVNLSYLEISMFEDPKSIQTLSNCNLRLCKCLRVYSSKEIDFTSGNTSSSFCLPLF